MIKILFMIHDLGQGGAEKVLVNLVNNMDPLKFDITVMSMFGGGVNEQFLKRTIRYQTLFSKAFPGNSHIMKIYTPEQLHRLFIKEKYDIEVAYLEGPSARIISGCPNKDTKLVTWMHAKEINAKAFRSYKESEQCYNRFDKIVCVSQEVKQEVNRIYSKAKDVMVLYNTNETEQILKLKNEKIEEELFSEKEIKLCGVGKVMPVKGFDRLARVHKRLRQEGYPVHTYILGNGPEKDNIENYLKEHGCEKSFTFLGYKTNPYKYLDRCNMYICSSWSEGFSTAATEALIIGLPVITTPVAGMKEMLGENNEYGIITEMSEESLYENIKEMILDKNKLAHYTKQAKMRGKDFNKENTVKAVEIFMEELNWVTT